MSKVCYNSDMEVINPSLRPFQHYLMVLFWFSQVTRHHISNLSKIFDNISNPASPHSGMLSIYDNGDVEECRWWLDRYVSVKCTPLCLSIECIASTWWCFNSSDTFNLSHYVAIFSCLLLKDPQDSSNISKQRPGPNKEFLFSNNWHQLRRHVKASPCKPKYLRITR